MSDCNCGVEWQVVGCSFAQSGGQSIYTLHCRCPKCDRRWQWQQHEVSKGAPGKQQ